jgi:hypothetical protein
MKARIAGLIILAALAAACLVTCVFWARMEISGLSKPSIDHFDYLARYWLIAFIVLASAWVVLLIRTIRYNPDEHAEER